MDPLSDTIIVVAVLIGVVGLAGGAWLATKTSKGWKGFLLNLLIVTLSSVMMLLSIGLVLNKYNAWYPSWSDVWGKRPESTTQAAGGNADQVFTSTPAAPSTAKQLPALPSPGERMQNFSVSTSKGNTWPVTVVLPTDYFVAERANHSYPVLMAGHGYPGSPEQWISPIDIRPLLDPVVAAKKIAPSIVVIPHIAPNMQDTECIAGPGGQDELEQWLAKELPEFLASRLRVATDRTSWAWIGFSYGGWCSAMMTMLHPDRYSAAVVLGGYFRPMWPANAPAWTKDATVVKRYDLVALAAHTPPSVALWVQSSTQDPESWRTTKAFIDAVKPPLSVTATIDKSGGHTLGAWSPHVPTALTWLGATVPGFKPA